MTKKTCPSARRGNGGNGARGGAVLNLEYSTSRPVFIPCGGNTFAQLRGNVLFRRCKASRHFLQKPPAIAFTVTALQRAERAGATLVEVEDTESGQVYRASLAKFWEKGFHFNRGFGFQVGLTLGEWETGEGGPEPPDAPEPPALNTAEPEPLAVTLPLFEGLAL